GPAELDRYVLALFEACVAQAFTERGQALATHLRSGRAEISHHRHRRLLRARRERPCGRRAAEQRDERAPLHSITSSARAMSVGGISRPSAFAVLRLITSSNLIGAWTGRSAGFSPLRMR